MHNDTNKHNFSSLIENVLSHPGQCVDNIFIGVWQGLTVRLMLGHSGWEDTTVYKLQTIIQLGKPPAMLGRLA